MIGRLNDYDLSHLLLMGVMADPAGGPLEGLAGDEMFRYFRKVYQGTVIANVGMDQRRGNVLLADGLVDLVAYGQPFIANPDLLRHASPPTPPRRTQARPLLWPGCRAATPTIRRCGADAEGKPGAGWGGGRPPGRPRIATTRKRRTGRCP
ncbi:hypothetical protein ACQ4WX_10310 [Streptomyces lasalocidi]